KSHIAVGVGAMQYQGDIPKPFTRFAIQGSYTYELTDHINLRGQLAFGSLGATDNPAIVNPDMGRPHPFDTRIQEISLLGEYNLFNLNDGKKWTPYGFIGLGFIHYQPYFTEYDANTNRYVNYGYPISSSKKLHVPFGLGLKFALNDNIRLFAEANYRYTTSDEIDGYQPTNYAGYTRAKVNDYFLSGVIGVSFRLGGDYSSKSGGNKSKYNSKDCPPVY
ncbi:MAG: hypothetical protein DI598_17595, partial [Pseudopedobacter saltans]